MMRTPPTPRRSAARTRAPLRAPGTWATASFFMCMIDVEVRSALPLAFSQVPPASLGSGGWTQVSHRGVARPPCVFSSSQRSSFWHTYVLSTRGCVRQLSTRTRRSSSLLSPLASVGSADSPSPEDVYEDALKECESQKLYGVTPKLFELDHMAGMYKKGRLNLSPKYQRGYVWKVERASRLVVTALCNRIVPGIVLHEKEKGKFEVVDGKQRLTTLLAFYLAGEDPAAFEKLREQVPGVISALSKLDENYDDLDGLDYLQLSEERQNALQAYTIPCTIVPYDTEKSEVFSCYEDINSGGEDLKAQQLRRAVYYGPYIELLDQLADSDDFKCIRDPEKFRTKTYVLDPKEGDRELVLRALAFNRSWKQYRMPAKKFLNAELEYFEGLSEEKQADFLAQEEEEFRWVMRVWRNVFGESDGAFRVWASGKTGAWGWGRSLSVPLWDVLYGVIAELRIMHASEATYLKHADKIQSKIQELFTSEELDLSGSITTKKLGERRNILSTALRQVLPRAQNDARAFPGSRDTTVKHLFTKQKGLCGICGQKIDERRLAEGDYLHLDHIEPFAKGGASTLENAALTHKSCNQQKGARQ